MKINTLRHFDIWIGRPVCWLLTLIFKIGQMFDGKPGKISTRKILLIKLFGMGSIVLAIPSINAIKKRYPESQVLFLTFKGNESVLNLTGVISSQNIYTVRRDRLFNFVYDVVVVLFNLIRERVDVVIDLEFFSRSTAILSFIIGARCRIGYYGFYTEGLKRGSFINYPISYNHTLHTSNSYFTLLKPLGIYQKDFKAEIPKLKPANNFKNRINGLIERGNRLCDLETIDRWIVINPNTSDLIDLRKWPGKHFVLLVDKLLESYDDLGVIFIGSKDETSCVESLCNQVSNENIEKRIINLAGLTSISDLIDIFNFSDLLITNDSGPAHLASLTKISSIVLFGPETPALYSPMGDQAKCLYLELDCQPCVTVYNGKHSYCHDNICLQKISPDTVFKIASDFL